MLTSLRSICWLPDWSANKHTIKYSHGYLKQIATWPMSQLQSCIDFVVEQIAKFQNSCTFLSNCNKGTQSNAREQWDNVFLKRDNRQVKIVSYFALLVTFFIKAVHLINTLIHYCCADNICKQSSANTQRNASVIVGSFNS